MGGTLQRKLTSRVTIFITNAEGGQLVYLLDRVRKICPQCRVVSILWFEKCFEMKSKVSFEGYEMDTPETMLKRVK